MMAKHVFMLVGALAALAMSLGACIVPIPTVPQAPASGTAPGHAGSHGQPPPPAPVPAVSLDLSAWTIAHNRQGSIALHHLHRLHQRPAGQSFRISSDAPSTAWTSSPRLDLRLPYRVTFWVRVSPRPYNGFIIYDAVDAEGRSTDIRVYLHDDRDDYTALDGWHGELWVRDAVATYSQLCMTIRRGKGLASRLLPRSSVPTGVVEVQAPKGVVLER